MLPPGRRLVLTHDLSAGLRKGRLLALGDLEALGAFPELHAVELAPDDVHEDEAARRLGEAAAGPGLALRDIQQSQARLSARVRGMVSVDTGRLKRLNELAGVSVFSLFDGQAVDAGEEALGCKVTQVAVPGAVLSSAEAICDEAPEPVVDVLPFRALRTVVIVTERLRPRARELFMAAVRSKLGWYGARLLEIKQTPRRPEAVREAYAEAGAASAELVLFAGASSIDPLDAAYGELIAAGGEVVRLGAPAHPGSMLWLGRLGPATVLGVASCAGFGKSTSLDLVLPRIFAMGAVDADDLSDLGHGGLIEKAAGRRFPPYS